MNEEDAHAVVRVGASCTGMLVCVGLFFAGGVTGRVDLLLWSLGLFLALAVFSSFYQFFGS